MTATPIDLFSSFLQLGADGQVRAEKPAFDPRRENWQVMTFHVETDADVHGDHWEIHTLADEVVSCLSGGIRLYLRPEGAEPGESAESAESGHGPGEGYEEEIKLSPGSATIVPRGRWHRIALDGPSDIMSITLPRGSRLEKRATA
ncbi:cupin [Streptomyces sp. ODS28]|uniref:cupin n=1 Tax=Streptomyces sp. ODS28 TaxID=3136688 RepID=UPI0031EBF0E7